MRPWSLQSRLLLVLATALVGFLGLTGFALDQAFRESTLTALRERLQSYVWAYIAGSDPTISRRLVLPEVAPEPRFDQPGSGLYAGITGDGLRWESASALARDLPFDDELPPGEIRFDGPLDSPVGDIFRFSQGVVWELPDDEELRLTIHVAEHASGLREQIGVFRQTLWVYLGAAGMFLLVIMLGLFRWGLSPLRRVQSELTRIESGHLQRLSGHYPREIQGLTESVNDFIVTEREHLVRYRNTLADLAHSLKTPLAVMRTRLEGDDTPMTACRDLLSQVRRMDEIVAYQLSRAATSGHQTFATPLAIEPAAEEVVRSLEKVYATRGIVCEFEIDPQARFYGERGDLLELLGNLLENAFKWSRGRVMLSARQIALPGARRKALEIAVEDDGPGIPEDRVSDVLKRGVRGDERVEGHGIGMAIIQDILRAYRGSLDVGRSGALGGASFRLRVP
ncbi:MAG: two-component sensor histidine kinase [Xanthomonadales bacterium]|nr:two-component sensor histidine kinase [Xanthomonadales bacterium]